MRICVDAGHGGLPPTGDPGAVGRVSDLLHPPWRDSALVALDTILPGPGLLPESWVNLNMAVRLKNVLVGRGHEVVMTRTADRPLKPTKAADLTARTKKAAGCDAFISLHCNAATNDDARGIEAYVQKGDARSKPLAAEILRGIQGHWNLTIQNRGVKEENFAVLRGTYKRMPAVLVEAAFLSNATDAGWLGNKLYRQAVATACADAIERCLG